MRPVVRFAVVSDKRNKQVNPKSHFSYFLRSQLSTSMSAFQTFNQITRVRTCKIRGQQCRFGQSTDPVYFRMVCITSPCSSIFILGSMGQTQIRIRIFSFAWFIHYFQFTFQAHWLLHSIVTRDTMSIPDRLDFFQVTEIAFTHLIFRSQCLDTFVHGHRYRMPCYGNRILMLVTSYATLVRLQSRPATHRLNDTSVFIQCLKI